MRKFTIIITLLLLLAYLAPTASLAQSQPDCEFEYIVQAGDWLSKIAEKYYGDVLAYSTIVEANNVLGDDNYVNIDDPNLIEPGWLLCIPSDDDPATGPQPAPEGLSSEELANATYKSEWTQDGLAPLTNGEYREQAAPGSATETVVQLTGNAAYGQLNGQPAAAVILVTDPGGSGTFFDLAVVVNQAGQPVNVAMTSLGDRVKINALAIERDEIVVDMVQAGPDDPLCCPSQQVIKRFALQGEQLVETSSEVVSPDIIGLVWTWTAFQDQSEQNDIAVPDPDNYTLELKPDGQFSFKADCNIGSGTYTLTGSQINLELGPITLAECGPQSLSDQYLKLLGDAVTYVQEGEQLFLNLIADAGNMVFAKATPKQALAGTSWRLTSLNGNAPAPGTTVTANFGEDGRLTGSSGCNSYQTPFEVEGNSISVDLIAGTLMACPEPIGSQETAFLTALQTAATYQIQGEELALQDAAGNVTATFTALKPLTLAGTSWLVQAYNNGQQAVVSVIIGTELTATFGEDGNLTGTAGCNDYSAPYQVEGDNISIGPAAATQMVCAEPEGIMEQEQQYLAALQTAATYRFPGDRIELRTAEGSRVATLVAAVSGWVTYQQDIALPDDAILQVQLQDVSLADAPAEVIGEWGRLIAGQPVPIPFQVTYNPADIDPRHTYALNVRITDGDGKLLFINTQAYDVITQGNPSFKIEVTVEPT